ncbi:MAG: YfjI family protein, partial [Planctomycetota bacterium]
MTKNDDLTEKIVATYDYKDEAGKLLFQTVRLEPKDFRQRRPDGNGNWIWNLDGLQRVLYRLPELLQASKQDWVFIVEGEKDVDRLYDEGLSATCNPGGALKWCDDYNRYFEGRLVAILPDNDGSGAKHAAQIAHSLHRIATEIRIVELPGLPEKGDVSDWLDSGHRASELLELIDKAKPFEPSRISAHEQQPAWEVPAPLGHFDLPTFPLEAFPRQLCVLCAFCEAVAESFQVPADLPAMLVLSVGGASLAKRVVVHVRGDHWEPVNLFTVVALPPGNRKSGVFRPVTEPLVFLEQQEIERLAPIIEQNRNQRTILEESLKHAQRQAAKLTKEEDRKAQKKLATEIVEELIELEVIKAPQYIGDDATPESVALLLSDNAGRFALLSPEGDVFDLMAGRYSSTGTPNLGVYLKGHAGDDIRVNRANRDFVPRYVRKPALTIGIAIQPEVLRGLTLKKGFRGRGLLGRFLYSLPQSLLGRRKINPSPVDPNTAEAYRNVILDALRLKPNLDADSNPCPHIVTVGAHALKELDRFAMEVEEHLGPGGDFASMGDWAGKLVGAVCRIAGIFHGLIHAHSGNPRRNQIDAETMLGAIAIGEYLIPHAKAAFFEMGADPAIDAARRILSWASRVRMP